MVTKKTAIMYGSCLNPAQLSSHLGRLIREGFIERESERSLYRATQKGRRYIKAFERCSETKRLLAEQERALDEFWRNGEESRLKEVISDEHTSQKRGMQ